MNKQQETPSNALHPNDQVFSSVSIKNYIASFISQFGTQGLAYSMFSSYLLVVYTEYLGVSAAAISLVTSVGIFVDCISDIIMGNVVDRVHTKYGKVKHWFLWTALPIGITIGLMFMAPVSSSDAVKLIWAMIIYNLYCTFLTAARLPSFAMQSACSDNSRVRVLLVWFASYGTNLAATITGWIISPVVGCFSDQLTGYRALGWIMGGLTVVCLVIVFSLLNEKRKGADLELIEQERREKAHTDKSMSLAEQYSYLVRNKYWIGFQISGMCNSMSLGFLLGSMGVFALHVLGPTGYAGDNPMGILTTIMNVPMMVAPLLILPLIKKLDAKTIVVVFSAIGAVGCLFMWLNGMNSYLTFIITMVLAQCTGACVNGSQNVLLTRAVDYGEWKFGVRQEGVASSFSSALNKICAGIATAVLGIVLAKAGYSDAGLPEAGVTAVIALFMGVPAVARCCCAILFSFLGMGGKEWTQIRAELDERHAAEAAKQ